MDPLPRTERNVAAMVQEDGNCGWKRLLAVAVIVAAVFFGVIGLLSQLNLHEYIAGCMSGDIGLWTTIAGFGVAGIVTFLLTTRYFLDYKKQKSTTVDAIN